MSLSPTPTIRSLASQAIANGAIDLSQGVVHATPPAILFELFEKTYQDRLVHGYAPPQGDTIFVQAITKLIYQEGYESVQEDNVMATVGVIGGIISSLLSHCQAGTRVIIPEPFFSGYPWAIQAAHCEPIAIPSCDNWGPNWALIAQEASQAQAILIANPGNPSGYMLKPEDIENLLSIAKKYHLLVIADEIYSDFIWDGKYHSLVSEALNNDFVVVLRGFAKNLALAGWRIGYAISTPSRITAIANAHDKLCPGGVSVLQRIVGEAWLHHEDQLRVYIQELTTTIRKSRDALAEIFSNLEMKPIMPPGAIYMLLKHHRENDIVAAQEIMARGVAITPGRSFFGNNQSPSEFVRLHFAIPTATVEEVKKRLS